MYTSATVGCYSYADQYDICNDADVVFCGGDPCVVRPDLKPVHGRVPPNISCGLCGNCRVLNIRSI